MPLNLNSDKLIVVVKPEQQPLVVTGFTPTVITGSGATIVTNPSYQHFVIYSNPTGVTTTLVGSGETTVNNISGQTWVINTPATDLSNYYTTGQTQALISGFTTGYTFTASGGTVLGGTGNNIIIYSPTGGTGGFTGNTFTQSGATVITQVGDNVNIYSPIVDLSPYTTKVQFTGHTGNTSIHTPYSAITAYVQSQISGFTTGNTFTQSGATVITQLGDNVNIYTPIVDLSPYLLESIFSGYTGQTQQTLTGMTADIQYLSGVTSGMTADITFLGDFTGDTLQQYTDLKEPSGFVDPSAIVVTYSYSARTITLSGNLDYYWHGVKHTLSSPWTSTPHAASVDNWYLSTTDGQNFTWSNNVWNFYDMQVAFGRYQATSGATFFGREVHGAMDWRVHQELHYKLGAYHVSGAQAIAGTYTGGTASDSANSPSFAQGVIQDEDCPTTIPQWNKTDGYTVMRVSGATSVFTMANTVPFLALAANNYMYVNNPTTGALTPGINARWYNVYQILVPVTSDAPSQKYRMVFLLPQATYTTLAGAQAESTLGLQLGSLGTSSPELVIYGRITYATAVANNNYGRCSIAGITYVLNNAGSAVNIGGVSATDHANLSNLLWDDSGHIGASDYLAAFNAGGVAVGIPKTTYSLSGHSHSRYLNLSGGTITGLVRFDYAPEMNGSSTSSKYIYYRNNTSGFYQYRQGVKTDGTWELVRYNTGGTAQYTAMDSDAGGLVNFQQGIKLAGTQVTKSAAWLNATITGVTTAQVTGITSTLYVPLSAYQTYTGTTAPNTYAQKSLAVTGATSMGGKTLIHATPVSGNKIQLKGLSGGTNITITTGATYLTISSTGGGSSAWSGITGKPAWLSGTTLGAFEAQHAHASLYVPLVASISTKTGTTYTALSTDIGKVLEFSATGATTITLPTGLTVGTQYTFVNLGGQVITFTAGSGVTLYSKSAAVRLESMYAGASAYYRASGKWLLIGDLT